MTKQQSGDRIDAILEMLESIASLDFTKRIAISSKVDNIDAIASGLNMLSEELESSVVERSKLEEINNNLERFAHVAAHDMKSPLAVSTTIIKFIESELKDHDNEQVAEYLVMLKETNKLMSRLITGILKYSKISFANMQKQEIDLGKLCFDLATQFTLDKHVVIQIEDKMPVVMHYETALTQVIINLLSNAVKHNDKETCQVEIQYEDKEKHYEISVTDNGPGILPERHDRIFYFFENLKNKQEDSTGIGLATLKKIVNETNGRIWVESPENGGARFIFTISK